MDLGNEALLYAGRGFPVFPLGPHSKLPLIPTERGGHGLHDATTDEKRIEQWWTATPQANIGLRTGIAFDVIDLDGGAGADALEQARAGRAQLTGPVVKTGKGYHYWVQTTGLGNRAGVLPGVDFRGLGGYVVAPPSLHPNGHRYSWINPCFDDLAPAPEWLLKLLKPHRDVTRPPRPGPRTSAYGRAALRHELERLAQAKEGTRNDQLNRCSFSLGQLVALGEIDEQETASALIAEGLLLGLGVKECERTVASGLTAG